MIKYTNIFSRKPMFAIIMFSRINNLIFINNCLKTCCKPSWKHVWIFNYCKAFPRLTIGYRKCNTGNLIISSTALASYLSVNKLQTENLF